MKSTCLFLAIVLMGASCLRSAPVSKQENDALTSWSTPKTATLYVVNASGKLVCDVNIFIGEEQFQCEEIQDGEVKEFKVKNRFVSSMTLQYDGHSLSSMSSELDDVGFADPITIMIRRHDDPIFKEQ